ncbi:hypothetical protein [Rhodococcus jostii]
MGGRRGQRTPEGGLVGGEAKAHFEKVTATVSDIAIEHDEFQLTVD